MYAACARAVMSQPLARRFLRHLALCFLSSLALAA